MWHYIFSTDLCNVHAHISTGFSRIVYMYIYDYFSVHVSVCNLFYVFQVSLFRIITFVHNSSTADWFSPCLTNRRQNSSTVL